MQSTVRFGLFVAGATFAMAALADASSLIGFWDFKDGEVGADVATFKNSLGTTEYTGTGYANQTIKPIYSSDAPGVVIFSDATCSTKLCDNPRSLAFDYPEGATSAGGGGYAMIADLALALSQKPAYTIEYFVKFDKSFDYWADGGYKFYSKTSLWVGNGSCGFKVVTPNSSKSGGHALDASVQAYTRPNTWGTQIGTVATSGADYSDDKWHHVAVVYSENGLAFFVDKKKIGNIASFDNTDGSGQTDVDFVLGTGRSGKRTTEPFHGQISCLRVSDAALTTDQFLVADTTPHIDGMGTAGFWDFSGGTAGEAIGTVNNSIDPALFPAEAGAVTETKPLYSSDTPGRYVYSDSNRTNLLAESPMSAYFGKGASGKGGKIELKSLASSLARLDEYTVEFFFKVDVSPLNNYRTLVGWKFGDRVGVKANLTCNSSEFNACSFEILTNSSASAVSSLASATKVAMPLGTDWHHFAAVFRKDAGGVVMYVDKTAATAVGAVTNQLSLTQYPVVLGTSAFDFKASQEVFGGNIACVRVSTRALGTDDFMVALNDLVPENTVFALNFEEGRDGQVVPSASTTTGDATSSYPDGNLTKIVYNLFSQSNPQYDTTAKAGRDVLWADRSMWTNNLCLWFPAGSYVPVGTANRGYYGAQLCLPGQSAAKYNPASWTMEAFVKLEEIGLPVSNVKTGLIFGKAGNTAPTSNNPIWYPRSAWTLVYQADGTLKLDWTERPTPDFTAYGSGTTEYYKSATTEEAYLNDTRWHHVALSYDATAKQFKLYVDYKLAMTQGLKNAEEENALFDGPYGYFFCRFPTTGGFEGWMDEIRFSSKALEPSEFERFESRGMLLIYR